MSFTVGDWLMSAACLLFIAGGIAKLWEPRPAPWVGVALICLGVANSILLAISKLEPS